MTLPEILGSLTFENRGRVRRDMRFEYHPRPCYYTEDIDSWSTPWDRGHYSYIYLIDNEEPVSPPSGMRSAVPLGGLGTGTVELRADGSFRDWTIFNNSPGGGGDKVQLDETFFAVRATAAGGAPVCRILRTHPPRFLPAIEGIEYSGSYPVSRLLFEDSAIPFQITLYASGDIRLRNPAESASPSIAFTFVLENPDDKPVDTSLLFVLPNHIGGIPRHQGSLTLSRDGQLPICGSMAIDAVGELDTVSVMAAESVLRIWEEFAGIGTLPGLGTAPSVSSTIDPSTGGPGIGSPEVPSFIAMSASTRLEPGEHKTMSFILGWHFPHRRLVNQDVGNRYEALYTDADEVVSAAARNLEARWSAALDWHRLSFSNTLPGWLQDGLANSIGTMAKTGLWTRDGRWRQWESFSCPALDPIHIHYYRVLPYAWFFPELRRSQLRGFAAAQREDGYIYENLGGRNQPMDVGGGRMMGDGPTVFILECLQDLLWTGDTEFAGEMWPHVKSALTWQMERSSDFGLPRNLNNTYDWWRFEKKELVSYNAVLHLAALLAGERLCATAGDLDFAAMCRTWLVRGREAVDRYFWTGDYYRSWWVGDGGAPDALHADTLYGELWARILGLGEVLPSDRVRSHLDAESRLNGSRYGLKVMRGTGADDDRFITGVTGFAPHNGGPVNDIVWEAGSIDWCILRILTGGGTNEALGEAEKIFRKWRQVLNDQWDIRDLTTGWDGTPWCNSHYARQLIAWAIPIALSGQQYSAAERKLSFVPAIAPPFSLPFYTPTANGVLEADTDGGLRLTMLNGELELESVAIGTMTIYVGRTLLAGEYIGR